MFTDRPGQHSSTQTLLVSQMTHSTPLPADNDADRTTSGDRTLFVWQDNSHTQIDWDRLTKSREKTQSDCREYRVSGRPKTGPKDKTSLKWLKHRQPRVLTHHGLPTMTHHPEPARTFSMPVWLFCRRGQGFTWSFWRITGQPGQGRSGSKTWLKHRPQTVHWRPNLTTRINETLKRQAALLA